MMRKNLKQLQAEIKRKEKEEQSNLERLEREREAQQQIDLENLSKKRWSRVEELSKQVKNDALTTQQQSFLTQYGITNKFSKIDDLRKQTDDNNFYRPRSPF